MKMKNLAARGLAADGQDGNGLQLEAIPICIQIYFTATIREINCDFKSKAPVSQPTVSKKSSAHCWVIFKQPFLTKRCQNVVEFRHVLSRLGQGDTRVPGSFIVSITDTYNKIAKFISTCNAMYGVLKL